MMAQLDEVPFADLDADDWQRLSVTLHAAATLAERVGFGEFDPADPMEISRAGVIVDICREWRDRIEAGRPKTALADRHRPENLEPER